MDSGLLEQINSKKRNPEFEIDDHNERLSGPGSYRDRASLFGFIWNLDPGSWNLSDAILKVG